MNTSRVVNIEDLRRGARRRLPRAVFDYIDGGADREHTLERNSRAYDEIIFRPRCAVAAPRYDELRRWVTRTVEGYDAADPHRFSTLALREEWLGRDDGEHGRVRGGYGAVIAYLAADCRRHGAAIRLGAVVAAIDETGEGIAARCAGGVSVAVSRGTIAITTRVSRRRAKATRWRPLSSSSPRSGR